MAWYSKVSKDISFLPDCIEYFYKELDSARAEAKIYGNVEKASALLPVLLNNVSINFKKLKQYLSI